MRITNSLIIAGAVLVGLVGIAPSIARDLDTHTVTVRVPGGGVETIEYTGKVAPKIRFQQIPVSDVFADPFVAFTPMGFPSFAALDRISAAMDQQMDTLMHQAQMLATASQSQPLYSAVLNGVPGSTELSIVSESTGQGVCTHITRITQSTGAVKPQVVSETSGDCGAAAHSAANSSSDVKQINYNLPTSPVVRNAL